MSLITLTPCAASFLQSQLRASGIPKEIASLRFVHHSRGYRFETTGQPKNHFRFQSRGIALCVPEEQAPMFQDAVICWFSNDLSASGPWWIDVEEMWNERSMPSDPLRVRSSARKIRELRPDWFGVRSLGLRMKRQISNQDRRQWLRFLDWNLYRGDSRAAVVLQTRPLLVAAYSDDLHAAAVLRFPDWLATRHHLEVGSRLVTVNNYDPGKARAADLPLEEGLKTAWTNFRPLIADFMSDEIETIERRRMAIRNDEYELARELGEKYLRHNDHRCRRGAPLMSGYETNLISADRGG